MIDQGGRWHGIFHDYSNPSFMDLLRREAPHLMPTASPSPTETPREPPHGTTVLSVRYRDGVIMAGDRWRGFSDSSNPSFVDLLRREAPHLMPGASPAPTDAPPASGFELVT